MKFYIAIVCTALFFSACNTIDVYEKTISPPQHAWSSGTRFNFSFSAEDSAAFYNIYFVIRHTESYHFNNIWLNFTSVIPGKKPQTQRINLLLANNNGWIGTAMDDIIEQRIPISNTPVHLPKGNYIFSLQQIMREDPLQNILNAGIRVEKVVQ